MTRTICIYHANCADGFTAAWAVKNSGVGPQTTFIPASYGEVPPDVTGANVLIVDFSYKRDVMERMAQRAAHIIVLDHHKTAADELKGLPTPMIWAKMPKFDGRPVLAAEFDMNRSGAQIAWDFFHMPRPRGGTGPGIPRPALVDYVADRDLWRWELPRSRPISAWIASHDQTFGTWETLANTLDDNRLMLNAADQGAAIERMKRRNVAQLISAGKRRMAIGGYVVPVANAPFFMASDVAGAMAAGAPFAATYFDTADGTRVFSLRSRADEGEEGIDVSEIARALGGGGHRNAAGFTVPMGWDGDETQF